MARVVRNHRDLPNGIQKGIGFNKDTECTHANTFRQGGATFFALEVENGFDLYPADLDEWDVNSVNVKADGSAEVIFRQ